MRLRRGQANGRQVGVSAQVHLQECDGYERGRVEAAVREVLEKVAPPALIGAGSRVLLKPNVINDMPPERAVCTHPEVVRAVALWALERGGEVTVADQPGYAMTEEAEGAFSNTGMVQACARLPVQFRLLAHGGYEEIRPDPAYRLQTVHFARQVLQADVVINLPKAKTHSQTLYTGAVKNMFGAVAPRQRIDVHLVGRYWALSEALVDCYAARPPHLHLMDAVDVMEGMGPTQGTPRHFGLLAGSTDGVALDRVMGHLMGFGEEEVATTVAAGNLGLGETAWERISVSGGDLASLRCPVERSPVVRAEMLGPLMPLLRWLVTARPAVRQKRCRSCGACAGICPTGAIAIEDYAVIDTGKCVECFCCQEACPYDAIQVKRPLVYNAAWRLKKRLDNVIQRHARGR